jgi:hypothetical protein
MAHHVISLHSKVTADQAPCNCNHGIARAKIFSTSAVVRSSRGSRPSQYLGDRLRMRRAAILWTVRREQAVPLAIP